MKKFRFYLDGELVHPSYSMDQSRVWKKHEDNVFFRPSFSSDFKFLPPDYNIIKNSDLGHEFEFICEELTDPSVPTWTNFFTGYFTKFDVSEFDDDHGIIRLDVKPNDRYKLLLDGWNKDFDITKLGIETSTINYKKYPVLQILGVVPNAIIHISGTQIWEEQNYTSITLLDGATAVAELFQIVHRFAFISGAGLVTPDVGGQYDPNPIGLIMTHQNGLYELELVTIGDPAIWHIREVSSGTVVWISDPAKSSGQYIHFDSVTTSDECRGIVKLVYIRLLCNQETLDGVPTLPVPTSPIVDTLGFKFVSDNFPTTIFFDPNYFVCVMSDETEITETTYGKVNEDSLINVGEYYSKPFVFSSVNLYPVGRRFWNDISLFVYITPYIENLLNEGIENISLPDGYRIDKVIKAILNEIDPSLLHDAYDALYSNFLYNTFNPITGQQQDKLYMTAKTNISTAKYDKAATDVFVKLKEILQALFLMYNVKWYITDSDRLKIEHVEYFAKGLSYSADMIGTDLTALVEPHSGLPWSTGMNKWSYDRVDIPGFVWYQWPDSVSAFFKGTAIEMLSAYANKESRNEETIPLFTTDFNFVASNSSLVSKDGLVLMDVETIGGNLYVKEIAIIDPQTDTELIVQNGNLSMTVLNDLYSRYQLPVKSVKINNVVTTALTTVNNVIQKVRIKLNNYIDPLKLLVTSLGTGEISDIEEKIRTGENIITVKHDTEI